MPHLSHLPSAMRLEASGDLSWLDDLTLLVLIDECDQWQEEAECFRGEIHSTSTMAVWRALVECDRVSVETICRKLNDELASRRAAQA